MSAEQPILVVTNARGRVFTVVYDDPVCPHAPDRRGPVVCIYDATYQGDQRFPEPLRGQFVSSYLTDTLLERSHVGYGLDLNGGVPAWKLTAANVAAIIDFIIDNQRS